MKMRVPYSCYSLMFMHQESVPGNGYIEWMNCCEGRALTFLCVGLMPHYISSVKSGINIRRFNHCSENKSSEKYHGTVAETDEWW